MKLPKNVAVAHGGTTFKGEVPDSIAKVLNIEGLGKQAEAEIKSAADVAAADEKKKSERILSDAEKRQAIRDENRRAAGIKPKVAEKKKKD